MFSTKDKDIQGMVFDIQRFSVHDGPGIRTTIFLKGCPLRCPWCQNPESQNVEPELFFTEALCILCSKCVESCPNKLHAILEGKRIIQRNSCAKCGKCVEACCTGALELKGRLMTVWEVIAEVLKDKDYYERSGGGVTLSGGEPLLQPTFCIEVLKECKALELHTAIETCGYASPQVVERVIDLVDLIMYDLKHIDSKIHRKAVGVGNELVIQNLKRAVERGISVLVRMPLIPGFNDTHDNLVQMADFLKVLGTDEVEILPYHTYALAKYKALGVEYPLRDISIPSEDELRRVEKVMTSRGLRLHRS